MTLGKKIKRLLRERKITQEKFTEATGIVRTTLMDSRRQTGWRRTTVYAAARFFGMTVEELVAGTDAEDYI